MNTNALMEQKSGHIGDQHRIKKLKDKEMPRKKKPGHFLIKIKDKVGISITYGLRILMCIPIRMS